MINSFITKIETQIFFFVKKQTFSQNKKSVHNIFFLIFKDRLLKIEEDCLKTVGGIFFNETVLFNFLVFAFFQEPIEVSTFDSLYLKNYFEN